MFIGLELTCLEFHYHLQVAGIMKVVNLKFSNVDQKVGHQGKCRIFYVRIIFFALVILDHHKGSRVLLRYHYYNYFMFLNESTDLSLLVA